MLILKRGSASRSSGQWRDDDYGVMEMPVSIPSPSRANKQRDEPALERRNQVGGLAHGLVLLPANGPIQSRAGPHWLITLDDTVNVITTAIQFRHIVMAVTSPSCLCSGSPRGRACAGKSAVMLASGHNGDIRRAAHGYEATREEAMAAFAKSWRGG
jgi:hypothetical protein